VGAVENLRSKAPDVTHVEMYEMKGLVEK